MTHCPSLSRHEEELIIRPAELVARGHRALGITLPGLDPDAPPPTSVITLDDHVRAATSDVAAFDEGRGVVLVGHSYGGSIISAVADAHPELDNALVYLDALLPEDGESSWSMTNEDEHRWYVEGSAATGGWVDPLPFFDDRARPHPLATLMQASKLTGAWRRVPVKHFVVATKWPGGNSPMQAMADRARADASISVHEWDVTHNMLREGPDQLTEFLVHGVVAREQRETE